MTAMVGFKDLIEPMTLGNMGADGVRSLNVSCRPIMSADLWPDHVPVPTFGPRMVVCTRCGIMSGAARPNISFLAMHTPLQRWANGGSPRTFGLSMLSSFAVLP